MADDVQFAPLPGAAPAPAARPAALHHLQDVPVELTVEIGRTHMTIAETLKLGPGSIVSLNRLAGEPVDLLVNGKLIARGEVVVIDEEFGLRITDVVSEQEHPADETVGATPLATPTVDLSLMSEDDIAAYLGGAPGGPTGDGVPATAVGGDDDIAAYLGSALGGGADAPVGDDDVAAYLGGLGGLGGSTEPADDPFAPAADADPFTPAPADDPFAPAAPAPAAPVDDPFAAAAPSDAPSEPAEPAEPADPFAEIDDAQLVSSHGEAADSALESPLPPADDDAADDGWVVDDGDDDLFSPR